MPCGTAFCRNAVKAGVGASMLEWTRRLNGAGGIRSAVASTLTMPRPASLDAGFGLGGFGLDLLACRLTAFFAAFAFLVVLVFLVVFLAFAFVFFAFFAFFAI